MIGNEIVKEIENSIIGAGWFRRNCSEDSLSMKGRRKKCRRYVYKVRLPIYCRLLPKYVDFDNMSLSVLKKNKNNTISGRQ